MELLPCGHAARVGPRRVCRHLLAPDAELEYFRCFTGHGSDYDLVCTACAESTPDLLVACHNAHA